MDAVIFAADIESLLGGADASAPCVSSAVLGDFLGVTPRAITELANRKILLREGRSYPLRENVRRYSSHLREQAAGRSGSTNLTAERTRLAREQADAAALKNAALRGALIPAAEVETAWAAVLRDVRAAMLAIPGRIRQLAPNLSPRDVDSIDSAIRETLKETASE